MAWRQSSRLVTRSSQIQNQVDPRQESFIEHYVLIYERVYSRSPTTGILLLVIKIKRYLYFFLGQNVRDCKQLVDIWSILLFW